MFFSETRCRKSSACVGDVAVLTSTGRVGDTIIYMSIRQMEDVSNSLGG